MDFSVIKTAVAEKYNLMSSNDLFCVNIDGDELYRKYLESFPGGDKIFRTRSEHECSSCRSFIKQAGNIVTINHQYELESIWDIKDISSKEPDYQIVAKKLSELVKLKPISNCFLTDRKSIGIDKSLEHVFDIDNKTIKSTLTWKHFYINIPSRFVKNENKIGTELSEMRARHDVLLRSLTEIPIESIDIVLDLINENAIYRGSEFKHLIETFRNIKKEFDKINTNLRDNFVWAQLSTISGDIAKFRNVSIGTLVINISEGMDIDVAVRKFEEMMFNYKRTNQVITKKQIEDAKNKIIELGLYSALERRYATINDVNINNLIFVDRSQINSRVFNDVFDEITETIPDTRKKSSAKIEKVPIEVFIRDIIPNINKMEILVENKYVRNFVSLLTCCDPTAKQLFKWNNSFSWSYVGDNADSIRERVKLAGGSVDGEFNNRVAWFCTDDYDAHMIEPGGNEIYYGRKFSSSTGGRLDVDMNAGGNLVRNPVENITYKYIKNMKNGQHEYFIENFNKRENIDQGFDVEIEILGNIYTFTYRKPIKSKERVHVATFTKSSDGLILSKSHIDSSIASRSIWNLITQKFHTVNSFMLSPNYWDTNNVGNKHYFFMINNCFNDGSARGFYNEFLHSDLNAYRKAMDVIGTKIRTNENDIKQLSGLGFSSTSKNEITVRVTGSFTRQLVITI